MDSERPSKWRRLSSNRLVKIDPGDPSFNFSFLGLPLDIKLLIIFRYLSVKDLLSMSLISKDYKQFIDQYFLRKEVDAPRCLNDFKHPVALEDRYVLSLNLDFDECGNQLKTRSITSMRERILEVVKCLNFSKTRHVSIVYFKANAAELARDFNSDKPFFCSFMDIFPLYVEISLCVLRNSTYLQSVDITIFMNGSYFIVLKALSNSAPHLREVTLRSQEEFLCQTFDETEDDAKDSDEEEVCYFSIFVFSLLKNTAITQLELVNIHKKFTIQSETHIDPYFLVLQSNTLERLILSSSSKFTENDINGLSIQCPNLVEMRMISKTSSRSCLYHIDKQCAGLVSSFQGLAGSLAKYCPRLKWFNNIRVITDFWYNVWDEGIEYHWGGLCTKKCVMHDS